MAPSIAEHVLRRNREKGAQGKRPQNVGLRLDQQRQAYARDVGAREVDDAAAQKPGEEHLGRDADAQRRRKPVIAAENAVARLANDQHQRDEKNDQVLRVDAVQTPSRSARANWGLCRRGSHRDGSVITWS